MWFACYYGWKNERDRKKQNKTKIPHNLSPDFHYSYLKTRNDKIQHPPIPPYTPSPLFNAPSRFRGLQYVHSKYLRYAAECNYSPVCTCPMCLSYKFAAYSPLGQLANPGGRIEACLCPCCSNFLRGGNSLSELPYRGRRKAVGK